MGITAENLAERYKISREAQDELAVQSHQRAIAAIDNNLFKEEIVPVEVYDKNKPRIQFVDTDEHPRRGTCMEQLSRLKPSFKAAGTVTPGNASGINDGSAGMILMSGQKAAELKIPVMATIIATSTTGVAPDIMGIGPVSASQKALNKSDLSMRDIQLVELNEAFAAQYIACEIELDLDREITNVNGSGIGLGHPVGATGARITTTLLYEMKRRDVTYGLAALCAGGGMGTALVIKR
jgi:acetyl-CoA C-acetyltransferase